MVRGGVDPPPFDQGVYLVLHVFHIFNIFDIFYIFYIFSSNLAMYLLVRINPNKHAKNEQHTMHKDALHTDTKACSVHIRNISHM